MTVQKGEPILCPHCGAEADPKKDWHYMSLMEWGESFAGYTCRACHHHFIVRRVYK